MFELNKFIFEIAPHFNKHKISVIMLMKTEYFKCINKVPNITFFTQQVCTFK